jgi:hypothetical protein
MPPTLTPGGQFVGEAPGDPPDRRPNVHNARISCDTGGPRRDVCRPRGPRPPPTARRTRGATSSEGLREYVALLTATAPGIRPLLARVRLGATGKRRIGMARTTSGTSTANEMLPESVAVAGPGRVSMGESPAPDSIAGEATGQGMASSVGPARESTAEPEASIAAAGPAAEARD